MQIILSQQKGMESAAQFAADSTMHIHRSTLSTSNGRGGSQSLRERARRPRLALLPHFIVYLPPTTHRKYRIEVIARAPSADARAHLSFRHSICFAAFLPILIAKKSCFRQSRARRFALFLSLKSPSTYHCYIKLNVIVSIRVRRSGNVLSTARDGSEKCETIFVYLTATNNGESVSPVAEKRLGAKPERERRTERGTQ